MKEWEGVVEKEATCVFYANPRPKPAGDGVDYKFLTNTPDGIIPAKTPMGMFPELLIDNDIAAIIAIYDKFYDYKPVAVGNGKVVKAEAAV